MLNRIVAGLLLAALPLAAAPAQPTFDHPDTHQPDRKQVSMDESQALRFMDDFARCLASHQSRRAAAILALPYGSDRQRSAAADLAEGEDQCLGPFSGTLELDFNAPSLAAGMAEYFVLNPDRLADERRRHPDAFAYVAPAGIESFGDCVVEQSSPGVEALVRTKVASGAEAAAADALAPQLAQCVSEGQTLSLNRTALRQLLAFSLYRRLAMVQPPAGGAASASPH